MGSREKWIGMGLATLAGVWAWRRMTRLACDFSGKVVAITGGARGLGLEMARLWIDEGARVAICSRSAEDIARAVTELSDRGGPVFGAVCDVRDLDDVRRFVRGVEEHLGPIDVLVNNAGIIQAGPAKCMTREDYERAMDTHFWGPWNTIHAVWPSMRSRGGGRIVNIASIGGKVSVPHLLPYSASKFALVGLSHGLAAELAEDGIYVTTVNPGLMRTGSPRNALFKGQHRAEYAWFSVSDSLPVVSMSSARAAKAIVEACRHGQPELNLSLKTKLAVAAQGLFPGLMSGVLRIAHRLLPGPGGIGERQAYGRDSESGWSPSVLTTLTEQAARRNNEMNHASHEG